LDISKNRLENVPDLSKLKSLKFLNASNNKITTMPFLPLNGKLDRIYFGENALIDICMTSLLNSAESITELLVQANQLTVCPDDIHLLRNLKVLDLSNNCLTNLPPSLGYMTSLQKILLEGNSIRTIKRILLSSPVADDLKTFLRTRGPAPKSEKVNINIVSIISVVVVIDTLE
jgi:Leucine-rich repeat (LRR) protein